MTNAWHKDGQNTWTAWGMYISKHWTCGIGTKVDYFMLFTSKEEWQVGNNIATYDALNEAKEAGIKWLNEELDRDLAMEG